MKEYEIYLPTTHNDGSPADPAEIERLKGMLAKAFGGYTPPSPAERRSLEHGWGDVSGRK